MRFRAEFKTDLENLRCADKVILRTDRGVELGEILFGTSERPEEEPPPPGTVLRKVTPKDEERIREIEEEESPKEFKFCQEQIQRRELPMRLVHVEHLFGGDKIIFHFLADGRIDFRQLVKDLAARYRTRIEMRQIGVRDEARLLGTYEHCGRELCCRTFMKELAPVTMRMAKAQKTTLDPAKISGRCGRLMCCLRFEDPVYAELRSRLPKKGDRVRLKSGETGSIVGYDILRQLVSVELSADRKELTVPADEIAERLGGGPPQPKRGDQPSRPGKKSGRRRPDQSRRRKPGSGQS